jgi:hypothetical protein
MKHENMDTMSWCESKTNLNLILRSSDCHWMSIITYILNKGCSYLKSLMSEIHMSNI